MTPANRAVRALLCALALTLLAAPVARAAQDPNQVSRKLREGVTAQGITQHLQALQDIATANGNTRASGTPGFAASRDYVAGRLEAAGLDVSLQQFDFDFYRQTGPASFSRTSDDPDTVFAEGEDFNVLDYSGNGTATGAVQAVDVNFADPSTITSGCEDTDFDGFAEGNVALLQRGTCTFGEKVTNAQEAGAVAAIVLNQGNGGPDRTDLFAGTLGAPATIPAISVSFPFGQELSTAGTTVSDYDADRVGDASDVERHRRRRAEEREQGGQDRRGRRAPGLRRRGPGHQRQRLGHRHDPRDRRGVVRAQGAGEPRALRVLGRRGVGPLGSEHYVASLSEAELAKIGLNLNFDMLASPNFVRFVYDGDGSATPEDPDDAGPEGSADIEQTFLSYFGSQGLATDPTPFDGRSDYGPFIAVGIPAGGLFSGAEGIKTAAQAATYGGVAGAAYDGCYHQACDTIANINSTGLDQLADGAAHATAVYAYAKSGKGKGKRAKEGERKGSAFQR